MKIEELKSKIESKQPLETILILKSKATNFIIHQYIDAIRKYRHLDIVGVESEKNIPSNDSIFGESTIDCIYLLVCDEFSSSNTSLINRNDIIIVCKEMSSKQFEPYCVCVPQVEQWQIKDYVYSVAEGVEQKKLDELILRCNWDLFRISNEMDKLSIFSNNEKKYVFDSFISDGAFGDISKYTIYDFTNALIKNDVALLRAIYKEKDNIDIEPIGLLTILYNNFRNICKIQLTSGATPENTNIPQKQFWAIKYSCGVYSNDKLVRIFEFISSLDKKVKTGVLPVSILIDYIMVSILSM